MVVREELAWAAGFFDGEGCTTLRQGRHVAISVHQVEREPLERLQRAVAGRGSITGPYQPKPETRRPIHQWKVTNWPDCQAVIAMLWPFLCEPKRAQASRRLAECVKTPAGVCRTGHAREGNRTRHGQCRPCMQATEKQRPPRAKPKAAPRTHCRRDHPYEGNRTKHGQCRPCMRLADKQRRG